MKLKKDDDTDVEAFIRKLKQKEVGISITGDGVEVTTKGFALSKTEKLLDGLIKKHEKFMIFKKKNKGLGLGYG